MKNILAVLLLAAATSFAAAQKPFPTHWGEPPKIQTMDIVPLPDGFGQGSSTLRAWINQNLQKDVQAGTKPGAGTEPQARPIYEQDFSALSVGRLPDGEFLVLAGQFAVVEDGGEKFLELPGAPLDTYSVLFGPALTNSGATVSARVWGTTRSRRQPTFGVGLGGASPWKLVVAPGKGAAELWLDDQFKASTPWTWKSGTWTGLKLEVRTVKPGEWEIRGKVWYGSEPEPAEWTVTHTTDTAPRGGRASIWGSPFAGTPIRYDNLRIWQTPSS